MKLHIIIPIICVFTLSCKKPRAGSYELILYVSNQSSAQTFKGEEYDVNMRHIYYKNGIDGTLTKKGSNVEGIVTLRNVSVGQSGPTSNSFTVSLDGKIVREGYRIHRITGTYKSNGTISPTGNFEIIAKN